jgi:hypothetical protein
MEAGPILPLKSTLVVVVGLVLAPLGVQAMPAKFDTGKGQGAVERVRQVESKKPRAHISSSTKKASGSRRSAINNPVPHLIIGIGF